MFDNLSSYLVFHLPIEVAQSLFIISSHDQSSHVARFIFLSRCLKNGSSIQFQTEDKQYFCLVDPTQFECIRETAWESTKIE